MDVFSYIDYERPVPLEFIDPDGGKPLGIVWKVMHVKCKAAEAYRKESRTRNSEIDAFQAAGLCVTGWDWGQHSYKDGKVPEFSTDMAAEILREVDWMFEQFAEKASDRGNFTTA